MSYPYAARWHFALEIMLPTTSIYGNSGQLSLKLIWQPITCNCDKMASCWAVEWAALYNFDKANEATHYFQICKWRAAQRATK